MKDKYRLSAVHWTICLQSCLFNFWNTTNKQRRVPSVRLAAASFPQPPVVPTGVTTSANNAGVEIAS